MQMEAVSGRSFLFRVKDFGKHIVGTTIALFEPFISRHTFPLRKRRIGHLRYFNADKRGFFSIRPLTGRIDVFSKYLLRKI